MIRIPGHENDNYIFFARRHPIILTTIFIGAFVAFFLPLLVLIIALVSVPAFLAGALGLILVLVLSLYFLILLTYTLNEWLKHYYNILAGTTETLIAIVQDGLLNRRILEIDLYDISHISADEINIFQTIFGFGNLTIELEGESNQTFVLKNFQNPIALADKILACHNEVVSKEGKGKLLEALESDLNSPKLVTEFTTHKASTSAIRPKQRLAPPPSRSQVSSLPSGQTKQKQRKTSVEIVRDATIAPPKTNPTEEGTVHDIIYDELIAPEKPIDEALAQKIIRRLRRDINSGKIKIPKK
jgi:hypothetical protein